MEKQIMKQDCANQKRAQPRFKEITEPAMAGRKSKVLLVEDNTSLLLGLMVSMKGKGIEVVSAVTKEEAVKAFAENKDITLVITDISYPEKQGVEQSHESGLSFIRHVKDMRPELKVIAQSSSKEYLEMAAQAGADGEVKKIDLMGWINSKG